MKKFFAVMLLGFSLNSQALTIDLVPNTAQLNLGDSLQVDAKISGLKSATASSLGVYDLNIQFDTSRFSFDSVTWGDNTKGNQLDLNHFGSLQMIDSSNYGWLNLFELSFDDAMDLENLQADSFTLFSLVFSSITAGNGAFKLDINAIGDAYGNSLTSAVNNTNVNVNAASVPEPTTNMLLLIGLVALGLARAKSSKK